MVSVARALGLNLLTREVMSRQQGPLRWRTHNERRVDVAFLIAGGEVVVDALQPRLCLNVAKRETSDDEW